MAVFFGHVATGFATPLFMLLDNKTPLAAALSVSPVPRSKTRLGFLVVKATFRMGLGGRLELDRDNPLPILTAPQTLDGGVLPEDTLPRDGEALEVLFVGSAHAPGGQPIDEMRVAMTVGQTRRELDVIGDRFWDGDRPTPAAPFTRMPIGWDRAFGGTEAIEVDHDSFIDVGYCDNPSGKGFNAAEQAEKLRKNLCAPEGLAPVARRPLPNVENPDRRIRAARDAPPPASWAPLTVEHPLHVRRSFVVYDNIESMLQSPDQTHTPAYHFRAVDDWILPPMPGAFPLRLEGLTPQGDETFMVPDLGIHFDFEIGKVSGTRRIAPHVLTVLPEQRALSLTYRFKFSMTLEPNDRRSARLRADGLTHRSSP